MRKVWPFLLSIACLVFDYLSKIWALETLMDRVIYVNSWMNFRLAFNKGAAFSFLASQSGWQLWILSGFAILVSLWLGYSILFERLSNWLKVAYALIIGGALGNVYDRIQYGHVVDFIQWHYKGYSWPIFNIADVAISLGVGMVLIVGIFFRNSVK